MAVEAETGAESDRSAPRSKLTAEVSRRNLLRITEIFLSLQGESTRVGLPTVFVRLTGCPLRCGYCDTAYAFSGGNDMSLEEIVDSVRSHGVEHVCVTGGEPLAQKGCTTLLKILCDAGLSVSLETSGAVDISRIDERVSRIVDIKTPGSGEQRRNRMANLELLKPADEVKFVICDRNDYEWARALMLKESLSDKCTVLFSPSHGQVPSADLAEWLIQDRLRARFQVQLHKVLWGEVAGK